MGKFNIYIDGFIGAESIFDFGPCYNLPKLRSDLAAMPSDANSVDVYINSGGGSVTEGFAIHDHLVGLSLPVNTIVQGMCGSIATVIAQAPKNQNKGGQRTIHKNSEYFIHNPYWMPSGPDALEADDLQKLADDIKASESKILEFYKSTTGQDEAFLQSKMKAQTTFTADEAKAHGFVDEVEGTQIEAYTRYRICAYTDTIIHNKKSDKMDPKFQAMLDGLMLKMNKLISKQKLNMKFEASEGTLYFDGELVKDTPVFSDEAMTTPAPDGVYTEEGTAVTVAGGFITDVAVAPTIDALKAENNQLKADLQAAKDAATAATNAGNETATLVAEVQKELLAMKAAFTTGANAPAATQTQGRTNGTTAEPTGLDAVLAHRKAKEAAAKK